MKKLSKKVFLSIFSILSFFLVFSIIVYNIQTYRKEYINIYKSLDFINRPIPRDNSNFIVADKELDNMMIVDYEVYTVKLKNNSIYKIIGHGVVSSNFDVESIAKTIINNELNFKIGNLYTNRYAYNHVNQDTIVIINTQTINSKLIFSLIKSLLLLLGGEISIYFISRLMTKWITKPAEESFEKQKNFIADASHELKTPLAVIMASSDELKSDKKNSKYVENIKFESERMNKLITSLLDLSKLENGVTMSNYKDEDFSKIVEKICLTFEGIAFENSIIIESNIEKDISFKCSKDEIEKLISIILDNAIKHSYKDSKILVNVYKDKNNICVDIINSGDPIKSGDEEKIFERFYRADKSRKRDANRYGLGLAIAKNIVINHKGTISASSSSGKTTFKINFKK